MPVLCSFFHLKIGYNLVLPANQDNLIGVMDLNCRRFDMADLDEVSKRVPLEAALRRLHTTLVALEEAAERRLELDQNIIGHRIEVQALSEDRSRLAQELDASYARYAVLDNASKDVSRRLEQAMTSVRHILASPDEQA